MSQLCIIPARGGSKRIPRKNIRNFLGKPIIAYSIKACQESGLFDRIVVSTDDQEIAKVAKAYGAEVPFLRSVENSDDYATTIDVIEEVYQRLGNEYDEVCCVYTTAPLLKSEHLQEAARLLAEGKFDSVFPVVRFGFPIQRAVSRSETGKITMFQPEHQATRSQDLPAAYHDAGMFYWFRPAVVLAKRRMWTDHSGSIVLPEHQVQDIDTETDWILAEQKYLNQQG
jgi:N-acylneuraminate cytidylyltransferase